MHWHEDLQFIYVLDGEIEVKILDALGKNMVIAKRIQIGKEMILAL